MLPKKDEEAANVLFLAILVLTGMAGVSLLMVAWVYTSVVRLLEMSGCACGFGAPFALFVNGLSQRKMTYLTPSRASSIFLIARRS
jgi:hypothetical protein